MIEHLDQVYEQPTSERRVPPDVSIIMLKSGEFWDGSGSAGPGSPSQVTLTGGTASALFTAAQKVKGARVLNFLPDPIYLSSDADPAFGPPSEFVPPGSQDEDGNIWPGQFEFSYVPVGDWFAKCVSSGAIGLVTW